METIEEGLQDYYVLATSSRADERTRVIKQGDSFAVFDHAGTIRQVGLGELGIYHDGTRHLSAFELGLERRRPFLLGSTVRRDGVLVVDLANADLPDFAGGALPRDSIHLFITSFLWDGAWFAQVRVHNFARREVELELSLFFGADFADIFEARGMRRERRGRLLDPVVGPASVELSYEGLDHRVRSTRLELSPAPAALTAGRAQYHLRLAAGGETELQLRAAFGTGGPPPAVCGFDRAYARSTAAARDRCDTCAAVTTSSQRFDEWLERSRADLQMMITDTPHGPYPYAGVPWYSTAFGRDGIITALQLLWVDPGVARGVLAYLAATQATTEDPARDAEPGKIIHEARGGEMAALGEIPFGRYYGSVDATPLFVVLAGAYWRRTADREAVSALWPAVERALAWIDHDGDLDGDGFVEYARRTAAGLASQGWKDSQDSISHANGDLAEGPIALCEVQGYVHAARRAAAELARVLGDHDRARHLEEQAAALRARFEQAFWSEELGTYALALDGAKRPCLVRASNAGHCLWSCIATPAHAHRVAATLLGDASFSGWGIRTLDAREARYNPISYHNGSVWPHDNALIARGLARYGAKRECARVLAGLFDASHHFDLRRMPELFCGFRQRELEGPTLYPVACAPQAWSAGAVFMLLEACLGLELDAPASRIVLDRPVLPAQLDRVAIRGLRVGAGATDLVIERHEDDVAVHLERRRGDLEVLVVR
ncbi:MAG TPA: glycogen debranching N-terminal domain-containing protein [Kofleriaceae bacterium]|nr:glycogen debranching N-terminal domain-containing protein [Kofleriaceae bacterium]